MKTAVSWATRISRQIIEGILVAHQSTVLHRDIKPTNILVDAHTDRVKITDFGLAVTQGGSDRITQAGLVVGTPAYMPPEVIRGFPAEASGDIYSLGATLYHLFTGRPPYGGRSTIAIIEAVVSGQRPASPRDIRDDVPESLSNIVMQMLQPNPIDRLAALDQLAQVLDALIATSDPPSGNTVEERAVERRSAEPVVAIGPTQFGERIAPDGFFDSTIFPKTQFFANESVRFSQIESTLGFYREHLSKEYEHLLAQANLTYRLWLGCVGLGFLVLIGGVVNMLLGRIAEGAATSASTIIIFFIQKIFQQREDHYRALAKSKNSHLEYGDQWRLVIQSIDSIEEPSERARKQARLVEVLTEKLAGGSRALGSP